MKTWYVCSIFSAVLALASAPASATPIACDAAQLNAAKGAMSEAKKALLLAKKGIDTGDPTAAAHMTKWFGVVNSVQAKQVSDRLVRIIAFTDGATYQCETASIKLGDVYAYVTPDKSFLITLGSFFFTAPTTGFSSKMGTLVHEMSHFVLAGAAKDPKIYGPDEAVQLAKTSPDSAQNNAENIEYFVESILFRMKP